MAATPQDDLQFRGGKTISNLSYINVYVGGADAWSGTERQNINSALEAAMTDPHLNHVMMQYFNDQPISCEFRGAYLLTGFNPQRVLQAEIWQLIRTLHSLGSFASLPLDSTAVNFLLPKGMVLAEPQMGQPNQPLLPPATEGDSRQGLSGYHGSVHIGEKTVYFTVTVYSERRENGFQNGIPIFTEPWKNVVAASYHQLHEVMTDPDVDDANSTGNQQYLGWVNSSGEEVADIAIKQAVDLRTVIREVPLANGTGTVPVQLNYSNFVHGPEGPIAAPHGGHPLPPGKPLPKPSPTTPVPQPPVAHDLNWLNLEWTNLPDAVRQQIIRLVEGYVRQ